jgi:hypothetical protein
MKELEFRVWIKGFDEPFFAPLPDWSISITNNGPVLLMWCNDGIMDEFDVARLDQYTGLVDKNGRKIYEGDIITESYIYGFKNHVMVMDHFAEHLFSRDVDTYGYPDVTDCEVVGNGWETVGNGGELSPYPIFKAEDEE